MHAARFFITVDNGFRAGFHKQDFIGTAHLLQFSQRFKQFVEGLSAAHVRHQCHLFVFSLVSHTNFCKIGDQRHGHIIHTIKAEIFQNGGGFAFSRTGHPGYNQKFHSVSHSLIAHKRALYMLS